MSSGPDTTDCLVAMRPIQNTVSGLTPAVTSIVTLPYHTYGILARKYRYGSFGEGTYALSPVQ